MALTAVAGFAFCNPAYAQETIVDADGDGLIEIDSLDKLNNIRYNLEDTSYKTTSDSTVTGDTGGCPGGECKGYELIADLNFDTNGSGEADAGDAYYRDGEGWEPIGMVSPFFTATFEGNQHTISNLFIDEKIADSLIGIGLFSLLSGGEIRNLGLINADVTTDNNVIGALAGWFADSEVTATYMTGRVASSLTLSNVAAATGGLIGRIYGESKVTASYVVAAVSSGRGNAGGLVGSIEGFDTPLNVAVVASYAIATVSGLGNLGGLMGIIVTKSPNARIAVTASYAAATVSADGSDMRIGGLVGFRTSAHRPDLAGRFDITDSYFDATVSGLTEPSDQARSTEALQTGRGYRGIYANWNADIDGDGTGDDPWYFGDSMSYPGLSLPRITSGASAGGCPTPPTSFSITLPQSFPAGLLDSFTITQLGNRCVHLFGNPALRLKLRVFLESALP